DAVGDAVALADDAEQDVLGGDDVAAKAAGLGTGQLHHAAGPGRDGRGFVAGQAVTPADHLLDLVAERLERATELRQHLAGGAAFTHQPEQEVLWTDHGMAQLAALFASEVEHESSSVVVPVQEDPPRRGRR